MEPEEDFCSSVYISAYAKNKDFIIFCREPLLFAVFHNNPYSLKL